MAGERLMIIEPDGPQGGKVGVSISSGEDFKKLDEAVGALDPAARKDTGAITKAAREAGIKVVKP